MKQNNDLKDVLKIKQTVLSQGFILLTLPILAFAAFLHFCVGNEIFIVTLIEWLFVLVSVALFIQVVSGKYFLLLDDEGITFQGFRKVMKFKWKEIDSINAANRWRLSRSGLTNIGFIFIEIKANGKDLWILNDYYLRRGKLIATLNKWKEKYGK